jgi:hypothetical protein
MVFHHQVEVTAAAVRWVCDCSLPAWSILGLYLLRAAQEEAGAFHM